MKTNYVDRVNSLSPKGGGRDHMHEIQHLDKPLNDEGCSLFKIGSVTVETHYGFCLACSIFYGSRSQISSLEIIKDGKIHRREFKKYYTNRHLVTLAKQFAKEVFEG